MSGHTIRSLLVLCAALAAGCSSMNQQECMTADWQLIGYEDGSRGYASSRISNHRKACADHGVTPDLVAYKAGYDEGVRNYCMPETAYTLGRSGRPMPSICPADMANAFQMAYDEGRAVYAERQSLQGRINGINDDIADIDQQIELLESSKVGPDGQLVAKEELDAANKLITRLQLEKAELEETRAQMQQQMQELGSRTLTAGTMTSVTH